MHHVYAEACRFGDSRERVHVRAVHIDKTAARMNYAADLADVLLELPERVRIREHQCGDVLTDVLAQFIKIGEPVRS